MGRCVTRNVKGKEIWECMIYLPSRVFYFYAGHDYKEEDSMKEYTWKGNLSGLCLVERCQRHPISLHPIHASTKKAKKKKQKAPPMLN